MSMNWDNVSVRQYQKLHPIMESGNIADEQLSVISILNNTTPERIKKYSAKKYVRCIKDMGFLLKMPEERIVNQIRVSGKMYKVNYNVGHIKTARYIEFKVFVQDLVNNMHKIAASITTPYKRQIYKWVEQPYDAMIHEQYANDLQNAKLIDVYNSIMKFTNEVAALDKSFSGLFDEQMGAEEDNGRGGRFMEIYGWQYCVKLVADYENMKLNDVYELPVIHFLNSLSYLKAEMNYLKKRI